MIVRLSQKLKSKIKAGSLGVLPMLENPLTDWSAHTFVFDRTQYIIVCNIRSLYSTLMCGKGIANYGQFIKQAMGSIREFMEDDGQASTYQQFVAPLRLRATRWPDHLPRPTRRIAQVLPAKGGGLSRG